MNVRFTKKIREKAPGSGEEGAIRRDFELKRKNGTGPGDSGRNWTGPFAKPGGSTHKLG